MRSILRVMWLAWLAIRWGSSCRRQTALEPPPLQSLSQSCSAVHAVAGASSVSHPGGKRAAGLWLPPPPGPAPGAGSVA